MLSVKYVSVLKGLKIAYGMKYVCERLSEFVLLSFMGFINNMNVLIPFFSNSVPAKPQKPTHHGVFYRKQ